MQITGRTCTIKCVSVVSQLSIESVMTKSDSLVGRPICTNLTIKYKAQPRLKVASMVHGDVRNAQLMEFSRFNMGDALKKNFDNHVGKNIRVVRAIL